MSVRSRHLQIRVFVLLFSFILALSAFASPAVRSPWSGHPVAITSAKFLCPAQPFFPADLKTDGFYDPSDATHSHVDPERMKAYEASSGPLKEAAKQIVSAADAYRTTGSREAANCTVSLLAQMASNKTLTGRMSSGQAYYVQGWLAGAFAVADLKVRDSEVGSPEQQKLISDWLTVLANATRGWYDEAARRHPQGNNHLYWAGAEIAAVAAVADRQDLLQWAVHSFKNGADQVAADGTLPLELARSTRAFHYHLYALAPLVFLAEMGEANGLDLYTYNHHAITRLADACVSGLQDPTLFETKAHAKQEVPKVPSGDDANWTVPYGRRYPSDRIIAITKNARTLSSLYLGGLPPP